MTIHANSCDQSLTKRIVTWTYPTQASAGDDIADFPVFRCPCALKILDVGIIPQIASVGIDGSNSSAWLIEVGSTSLVTKTYDDDPAFPAKGVYDSLGTITAAAAERAEGDVVTVSVTNGTTAFPKQLILQIEYAVLDKAMFDTKHVI